MNRYIAFLSLLAMASMTVQLSAAPLGLPAMPIPADNPQSEAKITLGNKLFHVFGDIGHFDVLSEVVLIDVRLVLNQVDDAAQLTFSTDRELNRNCIGF